MTSDAGALLLGTADRAIDLVGRFADCFRDHRRQDLIEHVVGTLQFVDVHQTVSHRSLTYWEPRSDCDVPQRERRSPGPASS
ncbi:transposase [Bradyrhizobium diazoefficiens]|nr:transposase [Bradyrhizobium diazoefficiens]